MEAPPNVRPELACLGAPRGGGAQGTPLLASAPGGPAKHGPVCEPPPKLKTWDLGPRVRGPRECRTAKACISCVPRTPRPMLTSVGAGPQVPRMSTLDEGCGGRRRCKRESGTEASTKALRGVAGTRGLRKNPKFLFWGVVGMLHREMQRRAVIPEQAPGSVQEPTHHGDAPGSALSRTNFAKQLVLLPRQGPGPGADFRGRASPGRVLGSGEPPRGHFLAPSP